MMIRSENPQLLMYERRLGKEVVLCAFNLSAIAIEVDTPAGWNVHPALYQNVSKVDPQGCLHMPGWSWFIHVVDSDEKASE